MFTVDSNICIDIKKNNPPQVLANLQSLPAEQVCMSSITYAELFYGAIKSQQPAQNIKIICALKSVIPILPFDESAAEQYGQIRTNLENRGLIIGSNDLLIAAHALSQNHYWFLTTYANLTE